MMGRRETLAGFRMLVVEDEALVAMLIEDYLTELGLAVVEVAGTLDRGLALATDAGRVIDGAILDINLGTEKVFPVAAALADRGIPFVFATGYGIDGLGTDYAGYPVIAKPFRLEQLRQFLLSAFS
jgi:CheY-like chemotaxis protein